MNGNIRKSRKRRKCLSRHECFACYREEWTDRIVLMAFFFKNNIYTFYRSVRSIESNRLETSGEMPIERLPAQFKHVPAVHHIQQVLDRLLVRPLTDVIIGYLVAEQHNLFRLDSFGQHVDLRNRPCKSPSFVRYPQPMDILYAVKAVHFQRAFL